MMMRLLLIFLVARGAFASDRNGNDWGKLSSKIDAVNMSIQALSVWSDDVSMSSVHGSV